MKRSSKRAIEMMDYGALSRGIRGRAGSRSCVKHMRNRKRLRGRCGEATGNELRVVRRRYSIREMSW